MKYGKEKISNSQLMLLMISFIQGSILLISFIDNITKHDSWLIIISATFVSIPFILSYIFLAKTFPGKNLIQINNIIYGQYLGNFISILYICFFLLLTSLNLRQFVNFYLGFILTETPMIILLILFTLTCAYTIRKGIESITRICSIVVVIVIFIVCTIFILLTREMDFSNFLPILEIDPKVFLQGTHIISSIPFCDIVVFLMFLQIVNDYKKITKYTLIGIISSSLLFLGVVVRNTATLGNSSYIMVSASYQSIRLINIGNFFTRMEVVIALGITLVMFIKISVLYYATVLGISQILRLRSYYPLILPIGSISVVLAIIVFESSFESAIAGSKYHPILTLPFEYIIPPLSLLIAKIRKLPNHAGGESK